MSAVRCEKVMSLIRARIAARTLRPGERLPSVRSLAASTGISKSTVVEAYNRLVAAGAIEPRPGAGFYVSSQPVPLKLAAAGPAIERAVDPLWVSRQSLQPAPGALSPGCGWLPESWMPQDIIARALRAVARDGGAALTAYSPPQGLPLLRELLSRRLAARDISASASQIVLAESASSILGLICRFLAEPGDTVLVDDPCYFNFLAFVNAGRYRAVSVPYLADGPDPEAFARIVEAEKPRLYITNSGIHNPTGARLSPATAHKILKIAEKHDVLIIEDDVFGELEVEPSARYAALDGLERVIVIGSFSKTVSASFRIGYTAMREDWVDAFTDYKIAVRFGGNHLAEAVMLEILSDNTYRRYLDGLKNRLALAMDETATKLSALGFAVPNSRQSGMFLWCRAPKGLDTAELSRRALARNIVLAPGNVFSQSGSAQDFMRFNVAQCADPKLFGILGELLG
jgi:DNA-binding transcriptional MocR family regulator